MYYNSGHSLLLIIPGPSREQVGRIFVAGLIEKTPDSGHAESSSLENSKTCSILGTWVPI